MWVIRLCKHKGDYDLMNELNIPDCIKNYLELYSLKLGIKFSIGGFLLMFAKIYDSL